MYWNLIITPISKSLSMININMRCIEMALAVQQCGYATGLTLTWDVLKSSFLLG